MPTTEKIEPNAMGAGPDGVEFTYTVGDPQNGTTYPVTIAVRKPWTLTKITYVVTGTGSPTVPFEIQKNGTALGDFDNLTCTGTKQFTAEAGDSENDFAEDDTIEIDITGAPGGTTREFFSVTFHGEWL